MFYGHIPYYKIKDTVSSHYKGFIDMDRFWGCEISFDANMDHWFSIKNIKVGARPIRELREKIQKSINPTIKTFRETVRKDWEDNRAKEQKKKGKEIGGTEEAEEIISDNTPSKPPKQAELERMLADAGIAEEAKRTEIEQKFENRPIVFVEHQDMAKGSPFLDITTRGAKSIIGMNMKHPFFRRFVELRESVLKANTFNEEELKTLARDMDAHVQILLASFALAHKELDLEDKDVYHTMEKLMFNWTMNLARHNESMLEK